MTPIRLQAFKCRRLVRSGWSLRSTTQLWRFEVCANCQSLLDSANRFASRRTTADAMRQLSGAPQTSQDSNVLRSLNSSVTPEPGGGCEQSRRTCRIVICQSERLCRSLRGQRPASLFCEWHPPHRDCTIIVIAFEKLGMLAGQLATVVPGQTGDWASIVSSDVAELASVAASALVTLDPNFLALVHPITNAIDNNQWVLKPRIRHITS